MKALLSFLIIDLITFLVIAKRFPPEHYRESIRQIYCDFDIAKIRYSCDIALTELDYKVKLFYEKSDHFCESSFENLDNICKADKKNEVCLNEYEVRGNSCQKRQDTVKFYSKIKTKLLRKVCDDDESEYEKRCKERKSVQKMQEITRASQYSSSAKSTTTKQTNSVLGNTSNLKVNQGNKVMEKLKEEITHIDFLLLFNKVLVNLLNDPDIKERLSINAATESIESKARISPNIRVKLDQFNPLGNKSRDRTISSLPSMKVQYNLTTKHRFLQPSFGGRNKLLRVRPEFWKINKYPQINKITSVSVGNTQSKIVPPKISPEIIRLFNALGKYGQQNQGPKVQSINFGGAFPETRTSFENISEIASNLNVQFGNKNGITDSKNMPHKNRETLHSNDFAVPIHNQKNKGSTFRIIENKQNFNKAGSWLTTSVMKSSDTRAKASKTAQYSRILSNNIRKPQNHAPIIPEKKPALNILFGNIYLDNVAQGKPPLSQSYKSSKISSNVSVSPPNNLPKTENQNRTQIRCIDSFLASAKGKECLKTMAHIASTNNDKSLAKAVAVFLSNDLQNDSTDNTKRERDKWRNTMREILGDMMYRILIGSTEYVWPCQLI